jgi:hypothetical protein
MKGDEGGESAATPSAVAMLRLEVRVSVSRHQTRGHLSDWLAILHPGATKRMHSKDEKS